MSGLEKRIDELGRVVLPAKFRDKLGLQSRSKVCVSLDNNSIFITPLETVCALCGECCDINKEIRLYSACIKRIKNSV